MRSITLISTEHKASGKCNPEELLKIISSLSPDVIFEEETDDDVFRKYYEDFHNSSLSLEIQCIKRYLQNHNVKHIPVDIEPNQFLSFQQWDYLVDTFKKYDVYKKQEMRHCALRDGEGFAYLNSKKCMDLFDEMKATEKQLIEFSGLSRNYLLEIYQLFHKEHDNREDAMLQNIYNYTRENQYDKAVFLLGYAHRKPMIQKIQRSEKEENLRLNWAIYTT